MTTQELTGVVARLRRLTADVVELTIAPAGAALPGWTPGAHVDLALPSGLVRQYSLCGSPDDGTYVVAVLRKENGRGGSRELHETVTEGSTLLVRGPRNHFPLEPADSYLFLAGGIGVTPLLAMARHAGAVGIPWRLVYGGRTRSSMAYLDELAALPGGQVEAVPQDESGLLDLPALCSAVEPGTLVYACGPEPMLVAAEAAAATLPPGTLHLERFGAKSVVAGSPVEPDTAFEVELANTGAVLTVPPDRRLIDIVRTVVPQVPFSCEEGYCGSCETTVVSGIPDHRDQILTDAERAANDTMMICVGRARSARLVLDL